MTAPGSIFALDAASAADAASDIDCFEDVPGGLVAVHGHDLELADRVAKLHAENVSGPWRTVTILDVGSDQLTLLVHSWKGVGGSISVCFEDRGLRLTRPLLRFLAAMFFDNAAASRVIVRLPLYACERRATLARLGFTWDGLEAPIGRLAHVRLALTPDTLPPRFRRWRLRHAN